MTLLFVIYPEASSHNPRAWYYKRWKLIPDLIIGISSNPSLVRCALIFINSATLIKSVNYFSLHLVKDGLKKNGITLSVICERLVTMKSWTFPDLDWLYIAPQPKISTKLASKSLFLLSWVILNFFVDIRYRPLNKDWVLRRI